MAETGATVCATAVVMAVSPVRPLRLPPGFISYLFLACRLHRLVLSLLRLRTEQKAVRLS